MYALIGDIVGSRGLHDRGAAQEVLQSALTSVGRQLVGLQPLEPTVGDEFQGAYERLADAALAGLLVRLAVLPDLDVRAGIGHGTTTVYDPSRRPLLQDGPAWWAARDALAVLGGSKRVATRTWYAGPDAAVVNAHLLCRDALVDRLNERGWRMLRLALLGRSQHQVAVQEGITGSAVSQQFARGIGAVRDAQRLLEEWEGGRPR